MATVTGYTAARMKEIEDAAVVGGHVTAGDLILTRRDGTLINAGAVTGPQGPTGTTGGIADAPNDGTVYVRKNETWVSSEVSAAPSDGKKYVLKDGVWVVADRPWKVEFTQAGPTPPAGFTVDNIAVVLGWTVKLMGSGFNVNFSFEFKILGTAVSSSARMTLPASLRPLVNLYPTAFLAHSNLGNITTGVASATIDTTGKVMVPQIQAGVMSTSAPSTNIDTIGAGQAAIVRMHGSYTRASSDLPNTAVYV